MCVMVLFIYICICIFFLLYFFSLIITLFLSFLFFISFYFFSLFQFKKKDNNNTNSPTFTHASFPLGATSYHKTIVLCQGSGGGGGATLKHTGWLRCIATYCLFTRKGTNSYQISQDGNPTHFPTFVDIIIFGAKCTQGIIPKKCTHK